MTEIKNRIILDDQMSAALAAIAENSRDVIRALGDISVVSNETMDSFKLFEEQIIEFYDVSGGAFSKVDENTVEMLESFEKANEEIVAMIEKIEDKSKATESLAKSIERVGKTSSGAAKGFQDMTDGALKIAQSFGLISPHVAQGVSGVVQLGRGIAATIPKATGLAAKLAPFTLIAGAILRIVDAVASSRRETEEEVIPNFDELVSRAERLADESNRLKESLYDNVVLFQRLTEIGASDEMMEFMERTIEMTEVGIELFRIQMAEAAAESAEILYAEMKEAANKVEDLWSRVLTPYEREAVDAEIVRLEALIQEYFNKPFGNFVENNTRDEALRQYEKELADRFNQVYLSVAAYNELNEILRENASEYYLAAQSLSQNAIPAHQALADRLLFAAELHNELRYAAGEAGEAIGMLASIYDDASEAVEDFDAALAASAAVHQRTQQHILRAYRDTYALAESLRNTHYALTHAIAGTSSEYMSQLDVFNNVMNMSPQYLNFLFDEYGALMDVEDAVYEVTQAQIELLFYRQKNAFLDTITALDEEGQVMGVHMNTIARLSDEYKDLASSRLLALAAAVGEGLVSEEDFERINAIIGSMRDMETNARGAAREGGVRPDTISTAAGRAMVVADPANWAIRDEIVRLKEDITTRQFASGIYQQRGPVQIPQIQLPSINVYATPGMNEEQLARRVAKYCASYVADEIIDAYSNDLLIAHG